MNEQARSGGDMGSTGFGARIQSVAANNANKGGNGGGNKGKNGAALARLSNTGGRKQGQL